MTESNQTQYIYILSNEDRSRLYTGRTNNLKRRIAQHRSGQPRSFTKRYKIFSLVYYEQVADLSAARLREKKLKDIPRQKRLELITQYNPSWEDLFPLL